MGNVPVCKIIDCPYWSGDHKTSYGCQRWAFAAGCHLKLAHPTFVDNEYALYSDLDFDVEALINENRAFFLEDSKYLDDLKFQQAFPDWGLKFPTRSLD